MNKRIAAFFLAAVLCMGCASGTAGASTDDAFKSNTGISLEDAVRRLKNDLDAEPYGCESLNTVGEFEPVRMAAEAFDPKDTAFLLSVGVDESWAQDAALGVRGSVTHESRAGTQITVIFCGTYGEAGFVFEKKQDGSECLADVIFGAYGAPEQTDFVEMAGANYLLTSSYGHGTGTERLWTNWYNLDAKRVDLHLVRRGMENLYDVSAETVARTNVDSDMDGTERPEELVVYQYTSVSRMGRDSHPADSILLDQDCRVRVYASEPSGLFLTGERTFDTYAPAVIERTNVHDLLSPAWNVLAEEEILQTASFSQAVGDNMLRELLMANLTAAKVIHTDWVNLRSRGDIQSQSIGEILAGDVVYVLAERQGTENGWTQVIWMPENSAARMGYIWWSFLEKQQN